MKWVGLAWKNIWRNRIRSIVVIGAIAIGIWAILFISGFTRGMVQNYINDSISTQISHIQIHHPKFGDDKELKFNIAESNALRQELLAMDGVKSATTRTISNGMISSSKGARGVNIIGIDPAEESQVTAMKDKMIEGDYLNVDKKNPIILSSRIAEKLGLKIRSKVILTFQNVEQEITAGAFRVVGIYNTGNAQYDELQIYVKKEDLQRLIGVDEPIVHEMALLVNDFNAVDQVRDQIKHAHPNLLIENYKELSPDLELFNTQIQLNIVILTIIIMLALIFGIINTMLMAVLERKKELGMLMAIGMNKWKVFKLIVMETLFLSFVGGPLGLLIAYVTLLGFSQTGIDLSQWSGGLSQFGLNPIIYPDLHTGSFIFVMISVMITAFLASIYPARKAVKLKPVEALRAL